jgi:hypothetical protein
MTNFEARKKMWIVVGRVFSDAEQTSFVWLFSPEDMEEANRMPDGVGYVGCVGVVRDVLP